MLNRVSNFQFTQVVITMFTLEIQHGRHVKEVIVLFYFATLI